MKWRKSVRKWILDSLLLNPPPLIFFLGLIFTSVFSIGFFCAHLVDELDVSHFQYDFLADNIQGKPSPTWIRDVFPIDVVYTWVNGSDPVLIEGLHQYREEDLYEKKPCQYPSLYYNVRNSTRARDMLIHMKGVHFIDGSKEFKYSSRNLVFKVEEEFQTEVLAVLDSQLVNYKRLCFTSDPAEAILSNWTQIALFQSKMYGNIADALQILIQDDHQSFREHCSTVPHESSVLIDCKDRRYLDILSGNILKSVNPSQYNMTFLYLSENISSSHNASDFNRFSDNEELRYSLRSIEKHMPWVRKIFIVTNGQIPYWVNLMHPRLTLVSHSQIFPNKDHLPTFSSVAIEAHLHRIDGLSEHFIYFNDDFFVGQPVWPEDFYTISSGYQVYLSWNLPECSSGCPASWVQDGFCDEPCDVYDCNFDGGDCAKNVTEESLEVPITTPEDSCTNFCPNEWLKDSNCDLTCKVPECGFDMGDCGVDIIKQNLPELKFPKKTETLIVPPGTMAAWFDLSSLSRTDDIMTTYSSSVKGIRILSVHQASKIAILILRPNFKETTLLNFSWYSGSKSISSSLQKVTFNFTYDTHSKAENESKHLSPLTTQRFVSTNVNDYKWSASNDHRITGIMNVFKRRSTGGKTRKQMYLEDNIRNKKFANLSQLQFSANTESPTLANYSGNFPWEKNINLSFNERKTRIIGRKGRRKLLDSFGDTLIHVNKMYNDAYGYAVRKVPAHVPYFFNKSIIVELQERYAKEFDLTSSHKFRHSNDMQFSFAYFYYMMSEKINRSAEEIFDLIDTDASGTWSDREIRTFIALTSPLPVYYQDLMEVQQDITNCSSKFNTSDVETPPYERYPDSDLPLVTKQIIVNCFNSSLENRIRSLMKVPKFKYSIPGGGSWMFKMISSNLSQVVNALDDVRKHQRKFICLNNDMSFGAEDNVIIGALVIDLLEALFPVESSFELPRNYRNKFLYLSDLHEWRWNQKFMRALIYASICCLVIFTIVHAFNDQLSSCRTYLCRRLLNENRFLSTGV